MELAALALAASVSLGQVNVGGPCYSGHELLSTAPVYPAGIVDSVNRPGFNGRLYVRRPMVSNAPGPFAESRGCPGPEAYGAWGVGDETVWCRVAGQTMALDPFTRVSAQMHHQEAARQLWLRQRGYVGGVRTHVNDAYLGQDEGEAHAGLPQPRATITVPEGWRKTPTLEVRREVRPAIHIDEVMASREVAFRAPVVRYESTTDRVANAD